MMLLLMVLQDRFSCFTTDTDRWSTIRYIERRRDTDLRQLQLCLPWPWYQYIWKLLLISSLFDHHCLNLVGCNLVLPLPVFSPADDYDHNPLLKWWIPDICDILMVHAPLQDILYFLFSMSLWFHSILSIWFVDSIYYSMVQYYSRPLRCYCDASILLFFVWYVGVFVLSPHLVCYVLKKYGLLIGKMGLKLLEM